MDQQEKENQPKRKPGRPAKVRAPEDIDKLRGVAKEYALRTRGQAVDAELTELIPRLRDQARTEFPDLEHGERQVGYTTYSYLINDWFACGEHIVRNEAYGKTVRDFGDEEELNDEMFKPFEERVYADGYFDVLADEFVRRAKQHHLPPQLVQFVIRVLEAALNHGRNMPAGSQIQRMGMFYQKEELTQYLAELKQSGVTYREPVKPRGKPGPKPKLKVLEHAGPAAFVTNTDPDFLTKIAELDQETT